MSVADVHKSHSLFAMYPLEDFKRYYTNMEKVADKAKARLHSHSEAMKKNFQTWSRKGPKTSHGNYFWDERDAITHLEEDVKSGRVDEMVANDFWNSRPSYQDFKERVFRKHVNQEKARQKGGPYWQVKRNRIGQKKHDDQVKVLRREFQGNRDEGVNELAALYRNMKASG